MKSNPSKFLTELESTLGPSDKKKKRSPEELHTHKTPMTLTPMTDQWTSPTTSSPLLVCTVGTVWNVVVVTRSTA